MKKYWKKKFAWLPTKMFSGQVIWFRTYFEWNDSGESLNQRMWGQVRILNL